MFTLVFAFTMSLSAKSISLINYNSFVDPCVEAFYYTDADQDGCLSYNEWLTLGGATPSLFWSTDTNADGCIDLAEFLEAGFICYQN